MKSNKDVFERLRSLRVLRFAKSFCVSHREILLYVVFGGFTTLISILTFSVIYDAFGFNEHFANILSWVLAVLFAFITNRTWVFPVALYSEHSFVKQILSFFGGRVFTLCVEEVIVLVFIALLEFPALFVKIFAQTVVLTLNFFVSKLWVFKK